MRPSNWRRLLNLAAVGLFFVGFQTPAATSTDAGLNTAARSGVHLPGAHLDGRFETAYAAEFSPAEAEAVQRLQLPIGKPVLKSNAALIIDERTAAVLYSKQADVAQPIASITKLMTSLVVLDAQQPMDEKIEITKDDRDNERNTTSRLVIGAKLSRDDLMHLALMSSENRAAHALGRNYPGGLDAFVLAMNAKAKALGMTNSHFVDPTGLSSDNVASPHDLSKLVMAASRNTVIRRFSTDRKYALAVGRHVLEFRNTNTLVSNPTWDIVVQKTGYITEAGKCLVMQAMIEGRAVVIVLLDSFGKYTRVADAKRVRQWMEAKPVRVASAR